MEVAREVASASITIPVKDARNSTSTASIETGIVEGLGVDCCSRARPVGFGLFLSRRHADSESQLSAMGRDGDRESRLALDIPPRLGIDSTARLSKSSPQCDNFNLLLGGSG